MQGICKRLDRGVRAFGDEDKADDNGQYRPPDRWRPNDGGDKESCNRNGDLCSKALFSPPDFEDPGRSISKPRPESASFHERSSMDKGYRLPALTLIRKPVRAA